MPFLLLGLVGGGAAFLLMRLVTLVDRLYGRTGFRPLLGGLAVGAMAGER